MSYYILTFDSIHHVLKAEKMLLAAYVKLDIIPTPRNISSNCGMSIRIEKNNFDEALITKTINDQIKFNITEICKLSCNFKKNFTQEKMTEPLFF